jgi:hypothetical protein
VGVRLVARGLRSVLVVGVLVSQVWLEALRWPKDKDLLDSELLMARSQVEKLLIYRVRACFGDG